MWNNLSEAVKEDYGKEKFDAAIEKMIKYTSGGVSGRRSKFAKAKPSKTQNTSTISYFLCIQYR
jgi:hypothetical protein